MDDKKKPEQTEPPKAEAPVFPAVRDVMENGLSSGSEKDMPLKD
ncbi:MAG: hypothetical protein WC859_00820 [Elusimicrobiota bacterium]|jgi:hypothetical protein